MNVHTEQIWSFAFTDPLIFVDMLRLTLETLCPPPLIFVPSTRFQNPFCFLCHCPSLPPSVPLLPLPLPSLQPSPTAGAELISNAPSLFSPSHPSKLFATPSAASCLPSSPSSFFALSASFACDDEYKFSDLL